MHTLGYCNPDELSDEACRAVVTKLINSNIESYKNIINLAKKFRRSHSQTFRRYKHAGFPMKLGYKADMPFPYTSKRFDSYSMIFAGKDPLVDIIPVPYSESVIESYRNLVTDVQTFIQHMVNNHLGSLSRVTEGIIPTGQIIDALNYSQDSTLTDQELSEVASFITQFNKTWPLHARNTFYNFEITNLNRDDVGWYVA
jgi:hypothetical protein